MARSLAAQAVGCLRPRQGTPEWIGGTLRRERRLGSEDICSAQTGTETIPNAQLGGVRTQRACEFILLGLLCHAARVSLLHRSCATREASIFQNRCRPPAVRRTRKAAASTISGGFQTTGGQSRVRRLYRPMRLRSNAGCELRRRLRESAPARRLALRRRVQTAGVESAEGASREERPRGCDDDPPNGRFASEDAPARNAAAPLRHLCGKCAT